MKPSRASTFVETLGVGFGPAGIAVAAAFEDAREHSGRVLSALFLERAPNATWQPGTLLRGVDIQHHYLRDLATPRNPRSYFTFVNYLKEHDRLYSFGELVFGAPGGAVSRLEWADYVRWAADKLATWVAFDHKVTKIQPVWTDRHLVGFEVFTDRATFACRNLILSSGRKPRLPNPLKSLSGVIHSSEYLQRVQEVDPALVRSVAVVGSGQSAVEIATDLYGRLPGAVIHSIHRGPGFRHVDLCQFSNTLFHPSSVDAFHDLDGIGRREMLEELRSLNYGVVDPEAADVLYRIAYEDAVTGRSRLAPHSFTLLESVRRQGETVEMALRSRWRSEVEHLIVDLVVACTGFQETMLPDYADCLAQLARYDSTGIPIVTRDYELVVGSPSDSRIFVVGTAEATHGFSDSASFSMVAERAGHIAGCLERAQVEQVANVASAPGGS